MIHHELNGRGEVIAYDVEEIKCRRIGGDREIHWIAPSELCTTAAKAVDNEYQRLLRAFAESKNRLDRFTETHNKL